VCELLGRVMREGKAPADLGPLKAAAAMLPRIEKVTCPLQVLTCLNPVSSVYRSSCSQ
jgi:hypothetical protein